MGRKDKKKKRIGKRLLYCVCVLPVILLLALALFSGVGFLGKMRLKSNAPKRPEMASMAPVTADESQEVRWQEGWIKYQDNIYAYNEDILTFLVMGIDKLDTVVQEAEDETDGRQADALFLVALNPHKKTIDIIGLTAIPWPILIFMMNREIVWIPSGRRLPYSMDLETAGKRAASIRRKQSADCFTGCPFTGMPL